MTASIEHYYDPARPDHVITLQPREGASTIVTHVDFNDEHGIDYMHPERARQYVEAKGFVRMPR